MKKTILFLFIMLNSSCTNSIFWENYDESIEILQSKSNANTRMQFKLIQSKNEIKNEWFKNISKELSQFGEEKYNSLKTLIIEKSIPEIQTSILNSSLTYEDLVLFYLYRIQSIEFDKDQYLNSIISINKNVIKEAREKDKTKPESIFSLHGIPVLLKDNINYDGLATTAGSIALNDNISQNAFVVDKLINEGALILGKTNLSEWAYYFCNNCPSGYSAKGGQTLNPYARKKFDSGGSSSGSGAAISANFSSVSLGSETSGSILSPSSANSIVGLKPTIGLVSRSGIVPISSTLDTSGPMTKNVIDNAIVLKAISGYDPDDSKSVNKSNIDLESIINSNLKGKRFGVFKDYLSDSLYLNAINKIKKSGGTIIEFSPPKVDFSDFRKILDFDMKFDLPKYFKKNNILFNSINDIVEFNSKDSLLRSPYGQGIFKSIVSDSTKLDEINSIKTRIKTEGKKYFDIAIEKYKLDAIISINNYHAGYAAGAYYPCLTVPMGYDEVGKPFNLTFISPSFTENKLLQIGYAFEKETNFRVKPFN
ncbi:MAG: amidase [Flavobacteriaceae bacterium]|jgi:amidase|nr:amidase [Flavobacteriaceae bacterium]